MSPKFEKRARAALEEIGEEIHQLNKKWWIDLSTGKRKERNVGEMLMLTVSELAEAMEGHRKDLMDDHLPHRKMLEVELADAHIRLFDLGCGLGLDVAGALIEKLRYNETRADHQLESRMKPGGKKY